MRLALFGTLILLLAPSAPAQSPDEAVLKPQDYCTVAGVVVKSTSAEPLKRAVITAQRVGPNEPAHTARTDPGGRFSFNDLPPGEYNIFVNRDGYLGMGYGQESPSDLFKTLKLRPGERKTDLLFRLIPMAAVSGHVYDEDGEPMSGVNVVVLQYAIINGRRDLNQTMGTGTDDLGEYRLTHVVPGKYYLCASYVDSTASTDSPEQAYAPVYYPGTNDLAGAQPIVAKAGDQLSQIDFTMLAGPAVNVRGRVLVASTGKPMSNVNVSLLRSGAPFFYGRNAFVNNPQGTFELREVPPGSYTALGQYYANGVQMIARQNVEVGDSDVNGVELMMGPGSNIRGTVHLVGDPQTVAQASLTNVQVFLQPLDPFPFGTQPAPVKADGSLALQSIPDGRYSVIVWNLPADFYLKGARLGSNDVLDKGLTIDQSQSAGALDLVVSVDGGEIDGVVLNDDKPGPGATVVLVPDFNRRDLARLYATGGTNTDGQFSLHGIPPGAYSLFAWQKVDNGAWMDPDFLHAYEGRGKTVQVEERSKLDVKLQLVATEGKQ